jgi:hypothetical protein
LGVRLGDKARMTSNDQFVGDFLVAIQLDHQNIWSNHLAWISVFGVRIVPPKGKNTLFLEKRGNVVAYRYGTGKLITVRMKDADLEKPFPLVISSAHEATLTILGMQLDGKSPAQAN